MRGDRVCGVVLWFGVDVRSRSRLVTIVGLAAGLTIGVGSTGIQPASALCVTPVLNADNYSVPFGQTLNVDPAGLLANDIGHSLHIEVSWGQALTNPDPSDDSSLFGNAAISYGTPGLGKNRLGGFTYTPDPSAEFPFSGIDEFDYWAIDSCGNDDTATAHVTVVPRVVDAHYTTPINTDLTVPMGSGFLANDRGVDPASLSYDATSANGGSVDDGGNSDGSFVYTPPPDFVGLDSFQYQVSDLNADNTYAATVHIQVGGPSEPTSVTATARNHGATVSWTPGSPNGYTVTGYTVTALPGGSLTTTTSSPVTVTGLTAGTKYRFSVHANATAGPGAESAPSNAVVADDGAAPTVIMTAPAGAVQMATKVAASWMGGDQSGIARFDARRAVTPWNGSPGVWTTWNAHLTTSTTYAGTYGRTYCFAARAADNATNLSAWTPSRCTSVPLRSDQLTYTSNFKKATSTSAYAGFAYTSHSHGAVMTRTGIRAKRISLVLSKCSSCGTVQVRWNGAVLANVNTYNGGTLHQQVVRVALWPTAHAGTLTATVTSPNGKTISIEGLAVYNS